MQRHVTMHTEMEMADDDLLHILVRVAGRSNGSLQLVLRVVLGTL